MRTPTEIYIGGEVPAKLIGVLCHTIKADNWFSLDWGGDRFEPRCAEDLLSARIESGQLHLCCSEALDGVLFNLESFLRLNGIHYARLGIGGIVVYEYRGGELIAMPIGENGTVVVDVEKIRPVARLVSDALYNLIHGKPVKCLLQTAERTFQDVLPPKIETLKPFTIV